MTHPTLSIVPLRPAIAANSKVTTPVLIRLTAPAAPPQQLKRTPLHLALVIDRSGSMSGQPLEEAKRCAAFVVAGLAPGDRASLISYDHQVTEHWPAQPLGDGAALKAMIAMLRSGGQTDLHAGWFKGAESLAPLADAGVLSRVILLSDGCANHGLTDEAAIARQCAELAASGVSTSTYGLGGNFNESLMQAMARAGGGNAYYGATAEDLMDPFREELALLNSLAARRLVLHLDAAPGVQLEMLNRYASAGEHAWRLPDLAYGADAWALVRISVAQELLDTHHGATLALLRARITAVGAAGEPLEVDPGELALPVIAPAAYHSLAEDEAVHHRLLELETACQLEQARHAALGGDWAAVDERMKKWGEQVQGNPWLTQALGELEALSALRDTARFRKEAAYSAQRMQTRLAGSAESVMQLSVDAPLYLRRKAAQGKSASAGAPAQQDAPPQAPQTLPPKPGAGLVRRVWKATGSFVTGGRSPRRTPPTPPRN